MPLPIALSGLESFMERCIEPALGEKYRLAVENYHRLTETGILDADAKVELLEANMRLLLQIQKYDPLQ